MALNMAFTLIQNIFYSVISNAQTTGLECFNIFLPHDPSAVLEIEILYVRPSNACFVAKRKMGGV